MSLIPAVFMSSHETMRTLLDSAVALISPSSVSDHDAASELMTPKEPGGLVGPGDLERVSGQKFLAPVMCSIVNVHRSNRSARCSRRWFS